MDIVDAGRRLTGLVRDESLRRTRENGDRLISFGPADAEAANRLGWSKGANQRFQPGGWLLKQ